MSDLPPPNQFAEYPRNSFQPSGEFDRPPGVYFDAIGDAWKIVTRDLGTWVGLALLGLILMSVISAPMQILGSYLQNGGDFLNPAPFDPGKYIIGSLVSMLGMGIAYPVTAGLFYTALKQVRGEKISIADLFVGFKSFLALAAFGIFFYLALFVGICLCFFPMFYVLGAMAFVPFLIIDKGMGVMEAVSENMTILKNQAWLLGLFVFVAYILYCLGVIACCIGLLVTFPLYLVSVALHYHYYYRPQAPVYVPPAQG